MSIKTMSLETSETTHQRQDLITVGTAVIRGEDLPAIGRIYVFDIIDVVPEPDRPETGKKLKLIAKEEVKGGVTSLCEIGTQGFLLAAQGQKCMVRGLKEDGTLLPVAFMDMQCYVSAAKELKGTGLCVMSDAIKGIWFAGYTEDPYQLRLFGKSSKHIEAITADFLPDGKQLYIVVADADCNIHVLQFDPESRRLFFSFNLHSTTLIKRISLLTPPSRPQIPLRLAPPPPLHIPHRPLPNNPDPPPPLSTLPSLPPPDHLLRCPRLDLPAPCLLASHALRTADTSPIHAAASLRLESKGLQACG